MPFFSAPIGIGGLIALVLELYSLAIIIWVIASWVPNMRRHQLVRPLARICEPYLRFFRQFIPSAGGFDLSPIVAIFILQAIAAALRRSTLLMW